MSRRERLTNAMMCVCVSVSPVRVFQLRGQTGHFQEEPPHQQRAALGRQLGPECPASAQRPLIDVQAVFLHLLIQRLKSLK